MNSVGFPFSAEKINVDVLTTYQGLVKLLKKGD